MVYTAKCVSEQAQFEIFSQKPLFNQGVLSAVPWTFLDMTPDFFYHQFYFVESRTGVFISLFGVPKQPFKKKSFASIIPKTPILALDIGFEANAF